MSVGRRDLVRFGIINGPVTVQNGGILSGAAADVSHGRTHPPAGAITNVLINGPGFVPFDVAGDFMAAGRSTS